MPVYAHHVGKVPCDQHRRRRALRLNIPARHCLNVTRDQLLSSSSVDRDPLRLLRNCIGTGEDESVESHNLDKCVMNCERVRSRVAGPLLTFYGPIAAGTPG